MSDSRHRAIERKLQMVQTRIRHFGAKFAVQSAARAHLDRLRANCSSSHRLMILLDNRLMVAPKLSLGGKFSMVE